MEQRRTRGTRCRPFHRLRSPHLRPGPPVRPVRSPPRAMGGILGGAARRALPRKRTAFRNSAGCALGSVSLSNLWPVCTALTIRWLPVRLASRVQASGSRDRLGTQSAPQLSWLHSLEPAAWYAGFSLPSLFATGRPLLFRRRFAAQARGFREHDCAISKTDHKSFYPRGAA